MPEPWKTLDSVQAGDFRIFTIRSERKLSPVTGQTHEFCVIDCPNWVNVIGLTDRDQLVMVEQYRHGSNKVELEIPGGLIDLSDATPIDAALRELREETGFAGESPFLLGQVHPNPAIMSNVCYTVCVQNCRLEHSVDFDCCEDLQTQLVPLTDIPHLIADGRIRHSLVVVALYFFDLWRRGNLIAPAR